MDETLVSARTVPLDSEASRFAQRVDDVVLRLLPPAGDDGLAQVTSETVRSFRARIYGEAGSLQAHEIPVQDADRTAWHLVALLDDELAGCIRFHIFEPHDGARLAGHALANSGCVFADVDRARFDAAVAHYTMHTWLPRGGPLVQAGGLAVSRKARGSAVAAALCLAGNALIRSIGGRTGIVFASEKSGSARLCARMGCIPLESSGGVLGALTDSFHADRIHVMGIEPTAVVPSLDAVIRDLARKLGRSFAHVEATLG